MYSKQDFQVKASPLELANVHLYTSDVKAIFFGYAKLAIPSGYLLDRSILFCQGIFKAEARLSVPLCKVAVSSTYESGDPL